MQPNLPTEVFLAFDRILLPDESFNSQLNVQDTLNELFPDESSLTQVNVIQANLEEQRKVLQEELDQLVGIMSKEQDPERMQKIQELIAGLLAQMSRIQEKATESEAVVRAITKDIQRLDYAKKNLALSMTVLKRLQMLVNGIEQLDILIKSKKYGEIAQTLDAVKQLAIFFKPYMSIERVAVIWKRLQQTQGSIRGLVEEDFDAYILKDALKSPPASVIADACLVVDVLGEEVRNYLIERYCAMELKEYRGIFRITDEAGQLDNISRRFAWCRRAVGRHDEEYDKIFPESWNVGRVLCARFADVTADDISSLLAKLGTQLTVNLLLESLQGALEFEAFISKKYKMPFIDIINAAGASRIRAPRTISSTFEKYMTLFVDAQDKALSDMMATYRGSRTRTSLEEQPTNEDESRSVLSSSGDLFYFYRQTLDQCAKFTTGEPLYNLFVVFKKWLRVYCDDVLSPALKRTEVPLKDRKSTDTRFNISEQQTTCRILNTADYCHRTAVQLEDTIREKIDNNLMDKISMQPELDLFLGVISVTIAQLLRDLEQSTEPFFNSMVRTMWSSISMVTGQMPYILELIRVVDAFMDGLKQSIEQKKYLRNFFDKSASLLITKFTNSLVRSRPLKDTGAEQILFDFQALKACLLRMPSTGEPDSVPASYTKTVTKLTSQVETILKVVSAPADPSEGFIMNYIIQVGDSSFSNFQKVLDLKGTPRADHNDLLDKFLTTTSVRQELASTSFLSALDMEPGTAQITARPSISGPDSGSYPSRTATPRTDSPKAQPEKREVFSDLRKLVTFGVKKDREPKNQD